MLESDASIEDDMPSSLRELVKSNSQLDFFTEVAGRPRGPDSQLEFSSSSAGPNPEEAAREPSEQGAGQFAVVGRSEK